MTAAGQPRGGRGLAILAIATLPFALLTWWSVATPLIGTLLLALGVTALRVGSRY